MDSLAIYSLLLDEYYHKYFKKLLAYKYPGTSSKLLKVCRVIDVSVLA